ncbi:DUF732 domain-containing protein [[Mycobacterium] nativiensis]|uniref:DUF732 domain-containing protein n=1 Tax=[Mycobacterium] nativiensis TaxID=2855503 RepID=A0ABU5XWF0_9MYCO|nr:DUF732 domain-containing protein [Mycolicibacter sp. MYC340]MEB3032309.1 DUF732 domain-containing protein [Mycolicibacter sp. MYC340]
MMIRKPFLAAVAVAGLVGLAAPASAETGDTGFLGALDQLGISYPNAADAVAGGHTVCEYLASGHSPNQAAKGVKNANPSLTLTKAHQFVGIARANFCAQLD